MFLKSITIKGFKSFANKVKVDFEPAITGIIGPNGSGKSNISDAIRWVLGEQSAKSLRGSKMEDIIFAGSGQRRALGIAEVTLTLDNSDGTLPIDYKEVKIGRRVTRSGESDYLINNNRCRLKDVKELFMGTGVGKEAYSIIGQGKVEAILSENSTDRRELFEEAAGISKHKSRKEEAEKKLDSTEQKLQRINDIIFELEKQVGPLAKESEKAQKYQNYYCELEELEVNLLVNKYQKLENNLDEDIAEKQKLSYGLTEAKSAVGEYDLRIDTKKDRLDELSLLADQQKDKIFEAKSNVERLENKLELAKQQKNNFLEQKKRLEGEIKHLDDKIINNKEEIKEREEQRVKASQKIIEENKRLDKNQKRLEELEDKLKEKINVREDIQNNQLEQINKINQQQHRLKTAQREIERYQDEVELMTEDRKLLSLELEQSEGQQNNKEVKIEELSHKVAINQGQLVKEVSKREILEEELDDLRENYDQFKDKLSSKESRLNILKGMEDNYSGYYRGVKSLLKYTQQSNQIKGVCGVVAELISVPKDYESAIEVALGSALQNIVVEDDQVAKESINYLKKTKGGRATFLPLNLISERSLRKSETDALSLSGAVGVAADLINYDNKYLEVIKNLLGRVIIAKDIDAAVKVSKAANKRVKVVTLDGDIVNPGGGMTGGSRSNNNNILSRSREIEELNITVKKLKNNLKELQEAGIRAKEEVLSSTKKVKELEEEGHRLELEKANYSKDYQQLKKEVSRLKDTIEEKKQVIKDNQGKVNNLQEEIRNLDEGLTKLTDDDSNLKNVVTDIEEKINGLEEDKAIKNQEITELKVNLASLNQEKNSLNEEIKVKLRTIEDNKEDIANKEEQVRRIVAKGSQLKDRKFQLEDQKEKMSQVVVELKKDLDKFRTENKEVKKKIKVYQEESKEVRERYEKLQERYNKVEVNLAQYQVKLENIENKLLEEYELNVDEMIGKVATLLDYAQAEKEIKKLKRSMKRLEPVNLAAIEEYETLSQRFNFLKEQHQDLVESKESLEEVITEIEDEMKEKFSKTFNLVKVEFEDIFTDLFEGGQAELILEDEDQLLTTGIEINAQPPGKKLQKLSLMSGGEKALTATALIFSLLKVNPSPFYVLDELDAPLDDANVNRFANYLQELSEMAQFIIITHRKGTMAAVNALYGVTMQGSGVSELVSLKIDELEEYA